MINNKKQSTLTLTYSIIKFNDSLGLSPSSTPAATSRPTAVAVSDASAASTSDEKKQDTNMYEE